MYYARANCSFACSLTERLRGAGGSGVVTGLAAAQANLFLFSQRGRRQSGGKEREKEGGISRSHSPYPHAIFFWQILHHEE